MLPSLCPIPETAASRCQASSGCTGPNPQPQCTPPRGSCIPALGRAGCTYIQPQDTHSRGSSSSASDRQREPSWLLQGRSPGCCPGACSAPATPGPAPIPRWWEVNQTPAGSAPCQAALTTTANSLHELGERPNSRPRSTPPPGIKPSCPPLISAASFTEAVPPEIPYQPTCFSNPSPQLLPCSHQ